MQRRAAQCRQAALALHDVDLAAVGPSDLGTGAAEHPERGPESLAGGELETCFDFAGGRDDEPAARGDFRRRVATRTVVASESSGGWLACDRQLSLTVERDVGRVG